MVLFALQFLKWSCLWKPDFSNTNQLLLPTEPEILG
jgi:hypothetical protein